MTKDGKRIKLMATKSVGEEGVTMFSSFFLGKMN